MEIYKPTLPPDQIDYVFFTAALEHAGMWYKVTVAEEIYDDEGGTEATGAFMVLLMSQRETAVFNISKDEEGIWGGDITLVPYEFIYKLGVAIEGYHKG